MRVLLITGSASQVQGWGDEKATRAIAAALTSSGKRVELIHVRTMDELQRKLDHATDCIAWSSLYFISDCSRYIGPDCRQKWVAEILWERGIPYVGSGIRTLKIMIDKSMTQGALKRMGIPVPHQQAVGLGASLPKVAFPAFVKPGCESESAGVSEASVVHSDSELKDRVRQVHGRFRQAAVVEEYLPGRELTVAMLGNGQERLFFPIHCYIHPSAYKKYPIVRGDLKLEGSIEYRLPSGDAREIEVLASRTAAALGCLDHVRIDMREDTMGALKVIEVNGIPGLCPIKSRSLEIYRLHRKGESQQDSYASLVNRIVDAAIARYRSAMDANPTPHAEG